MLSARKLLHDSLEQPFFVAALPHMNIFRDVRSVSSLPTYTCSDETIDVDTPENQQLAKRGKVRDIKKLEKETNRLLEKGWGMKASTFETPDENNNIFLNHEEVNNLQKKGHIKSSTLEAWEKRINEDRTLLKETFEAKKPYRLKDQKRENTRYADRKGVKDHDDKNEKKDESEKDTITFY